MSVQSAADGHAPEAVAEARSVLDEADVVALVFTIATINTWNRLHVAARTPVPTPREPAASA